jgi:hypothetical protein
MELFLNLLWLALAMAALVVWRVRNRDHGSAELRREGVALVFVLVLMFFVISMTDDLHQEIILSEDCSFVRRQVVCAAPSHHLPSVSHIACHPVVALCALCLGDQSKASFPLHLAERVLPGAPALSPLSGRSPPSTIL